MEERNERQAGPAQNGKRPYQPPEILSQEVFETTALACGKKPGQNPTCNLNKKS